MVAIVNGDTSYSPYFDGVEYNGFKITLSTDSFLYEIHSLGTAPVPHSMIGKYTNAGLAKRMIDEHLEKTNETTDTSQH